MLSSDFLNSGVIEHGISPAVHIRLEMNDQGQYRSYPEGMEPGEWRSPDQASPDILARLVNSLIGSIKTLEGSLRDKDDIIVGLYAERDSLTHRLQLAVNTLNELTGANAHEHE